MLDPVNVEFVLLCTVVLGRSDRSIRGLLSLDVRTLDLSHDSGVLTALCRVPLASRTFGDAEMYEKGLAKQGPLDED